MLAIPYIRVSTDDQAAHGHSIDAQRRKIAAYAELYGIQLGAAIVDEGISGSVPLDERPGGRNLLAALDRCAAAGGEPGVIVFRLDRLFRDLLDGLAFFRSRRDVHVHSVTERIDTGTASGRLALNMMLLIADHERDATAERTRAVMSSMREQGRVTGTIPYGCIACGGEPFVDAAGRTRMRNQRLARHPQEWPVRELIVALAEGRDGPALSLRGIRDELRDRGIPSPSGGRWWSPSSIAAVIKGHTQLGCLATAEDATTAAPTAPDTGVSDHA